MRRGVSLLLYDTDLWFAYPGGVFAILYCTVLCCAVLCWAVELAENEAFRQLRYRLVVCSTTVAFPSHLWGFTQVGRVSESQPASWR